LLTTSYPRAYSGKASNDYAYLDLKQDTPVLGSGVDKQVSGSPSFLHPENPPKPQPQPQPPTPPNGDPWGYPLANVGRSTVYTEHGCMDGINSGNKGLKKALEGFEVDLEQLVFARMMHEQNLEGLTPMEQFTQE
jgi:hypothetical protein